METLLFFIKGVGIGLFIAVPLGPVGVLCLRRTLDKGRRYGLVSGLGAATADALYALVAGFGISWISSAMLGAGPWLRVGGSVLVIALGAHLFRARPSGAARDPARRSWLGAYASTFVITITSPVTILAFAAIFAGLGLGTEPGDSWRYATALVVGVFSGSTTWWLVVAVVGGLFRSLLDEAKMLWINRLAGSALIGLGLVGIAQVVMNLFWPAAPV